MAVEDAFGIDIPNADAEQLPTPRRLADYIEGRLGGENAAFACRTQRAFYRIRTAVARARLATPQVLRPSTPWSEILPQRGFRSAWRQLGEVVGLPDWPGMPWFRFSAESAGTLGDTAKHLATYAPAALMHPGETWTRCEVEAVITELIAAELGISSFEWDHYFARDLRID